MEENQIEKVKIKINNVNDVSKVVELCSKDGPKDTYLMSMNNACHIVRASSIMGVYSLNLEDEVLFVFNKRDSNNAVVREIIETFAA